MQKSGNQTFGGRKNRLQEVGETDPNYTYYNYIDDSYTNNNYTNYNHIVPRYTDMNCINPINLINQSEESMDNPETQRKDDVIDRTNKTDTYLTIIRKNLEYEHHMKYDQREERELFEEIYETVCDVVCVNRKTIRINGENYPYNLVQSRFLKLDSSHVEYVMDCMKETTTKIKNIRAYLITALYNAPTTMNHYYQQEVQHDMHSGYG